MTNPRPLHLAVVIGTRPEAVKLAPLVLAAQAQPEHFKVDVVSTGQHREMLASMLAWFGLRPSVSLDIMKPNQNLAHITMASLGGISDWLDHNRPDWVIVQGDTTTTFAGALAAFYHRIPVAHVEAGLRTHNKLSPYPEELNRVMTGHIATLHFPPTAGARDNLLREGLSADSIEVTGNTGIDALLWTHNKLEQTSHTDQAHGPEILLTTHRRENHGDPMRDICQAVLTLLDTHPDLRVHFPVHLSPKVREVVMPLLGEHPRVRLSEPLDYPDFVAAMARSTLILTDSGGVQEEAPSLGKPVLVLRDSTERPEAMQAGTALLVGADPARIVREADTLLSDPAAYARMAGTQNPYGDGYAAGRILKRLLAHPRTTTLP
ncbi:MAG: UDP-N-acetylglucosamine 2-epimerase (non-hydrolyzing) [Burkholderiales bacterium]|nr:UDP-N-acetylglucosamine 2-epimerase (non-hydrolyzing) [Burkholderiales bacterium]